MISEGLCDTETSLCKQQQIINISNEAEDTCLCIAPPSVGRFHLMVHRGLYDLQYATVLCCFTVATAESLPFPGMLVYSINKLAH